MQNVDDIPMTMWLSNSADPLVRKKILRTMPGKRIVFEALWGERRVVVKVFLKKHQAKCEVQGALLLQDVDVNTPELLYRGWAARLPYYVLIYDAISDSVDLDTAWWTGIQKTRVAILKEVITVVARMHAAGIYQKDLHLKNFLWRDNKVFVIDAEAIIATSNRRSLPESTSLKNLALLLAQFSPEYDVVSESWYSFYANVRNIPFTMRSATILKKCIAQHRKKHLMDYGKKALRTNSHVIMNKAWDSYTLCKKSYDDEQMRLLLQNPDKFMNAPGAVLLKAGNTCTVAQVVVNGKKLVIKRYNMKNPLHALNRAVRPSRAANCWRQAMRLESYRIPTALPVAMMEKRFGPLRSRAYFITEYIEGENLQKLAETKSLSPEQWRQIANEFQVLFMQLAMLKMSHGDFKSSNFIIANLRPNILDLDAMQVHTNKWFWQKAAKRDHTRFMQNWTSLPHLMKLFDHFVKSMAK